ncbi:hypothetical protein CSUNSWCD_2117 [Campylobacter showae CSUNSWCD]|uniref:Uncharacterized protein n=1 Tax=Campylobacter showae CSUNSWCD TaxID=1244083 RepID=M5IPJ8_9BACT|nr:hypothetical protein CSUNSWCD_2117 [Campylobacter showae CSUNSWCD]
MRIGGYNRVNLRYYFYAFRGNFKFTRRQFVNLRLNLRDLTVVCLSLEM